MQYAVEDRRDVVIEFQLIFMIGEYLISRKYERIVIILFCLNIGIMLYLRMKEVQKKIHIIVKLYTHFLCIEWRSDVFRASPYTANTFHSCKKKKKNRLEIIKNSTHNLLDLSQSNSVDQINLKAMKFHQATTASCTSQRRSTASLRKLKEKKKRTAISSFQRHVQ